ncbi:glycosyltransferase family 2 protein [Pseudoclavibacter sp. CFCC 13611]|nr:glycosyltransferase family 2 protein [Pseudoclavibacter sp. CFCC 13611]
MRGMTPVPREHRRGGAEMSQLESLRDILVAINPFSGLPPILQTVYWVVFVTILISILSELWLMAKGARATSRHGSSGPAQATDDYLWVFVVPALNEETTIRDSVTRLQAVDVRHRRILVVNDGSEDGTGAVLDEITSASDDVLVLTRRPPSARQGKAAALNAAYRHLLAERSDPTSSLAQFDEAHTVIVIVDADGRLEPDAPRAVTPHFDDARVGGVQVLVRIYNRARVLPWVQDLEFAVFGWVYQRGRSALDTANMGGNGQFNRLSALQSIADECGPWRNRLTEDQDLGVRLLEQGWKGRQENSTWVSQQGLSSLRRLYRQRVRWSQGTWQALRLIAQPRTGMRPLARADQIWYLLTPCTQALVGATVALSVVYVAIDIEHLHIAVITGVMFYLMSFAPGVAAMLASLRGNGPWRVLLAIALAHCFVIYSWIIYPVVYQAALRQLLHRQSWSKTAREPIDDDPALSLSV